MSCVPRPAGAIRITAIDYVARTIIWRRLEKILPDYPELIVEISDEYSMTDLVAGRYDIGVRHGSDIEKDMIAVRISEPVRILIVGSPGYFKAHSEPATRQDFADHFAANLRLASAGGIYAWELVENDEIVETRVPSRAVFNNLCGMRDAALAGLGLGFLPEAFVASQIEAGELKAVLPQHSLTLHRYHLFYPSRRQSSRALHVVVEALRWRTDGMSKHMSSACDSTAKRLSIADTGMAAVGSGNRNPRGRRRPDSRVGCFYVRGLVQACPMARRRLHQQVLLLADRAHAARRPCCRCVSGVPVRSLARRPGALQTR